MSIAFSPRVERLENNIQSMFLVAYEKPRDLDGPFLICPHASLTAFLYEASSVLEITQLILQTDDIVNNLNLALELTILTVGWATNYPNHALDCYIHEAGITTPEPETFVLLTTELARHGYKPGFRAASAPQFTSFYKQIAQPTAFLPFR